MTKINIWREYLSDKSNRIVFLVSIAALVVILAAFSMFLEYVENRPGAVLDDPLLAMFSPVDITWGIFVLIYGGLLLGLVFFAQDPKLLNRAIIAYSILTVFRLCAMYAVPFEAPTGMIELTDPLVEFFGSGSTLTKDLFFSGHTSILVLFALLFEGKTRKLFILLAVLVGTGVLLQKAHYTIDVFCAPFFAYVAYILSEKKLH